MNLFKYFRTANVLPHKKVLRTDELDDDILQAILESKVPDRIEYMEEEDEQ